MTPYPSPGQPPQRPPPSAGANAILWLLALMGLGAVLALVAFFAWAVHEGYTRAKAKAIASASAHASSSSAPLPKPKLPPAERHVPHHALSILQGCTDDDLHTLTSGIDGAISVGAPLYNAGNFAGCYHMYEGTAADLERKLDPTCAGPARALDAGRTRAASLATPSAQAWAMRDAFDGLVDVVARKNSESP